MGFINQLITGGPHLVSFSPTSGWNSALRGTTPWPLRPMLSSNWTCMARGCWLRHWCAPSARVEGVVYGLYIFIYIMISRYISISKSISINLQKYIIISRYIHKLTNIYIYTYIRTYVHTHIHTYIHAYINTYIHTYYLFICLFVSLSARLCSHLLINYFLSSYLSIHSCFYTFIYGGYNDCKRSTGTGDSNQVPLIHSPVTFFAGWSYHVSYPRWTLSGLMYTIPV